MQKIIKNIALCLILFNAQCNAMKNPFYNLFYFFNLYKDPSCSNAPKIKLNFNYNNDQLTCAGDSSCNITCAQDYDTLLHNTIQNYTSHASTLNHEELIQERNALGTTYQSLKAQCDKINHSNPLLTEICKEATNLNYFSFDQALDQVIKKLPRGKQAQCFKDISTIKNLNFEMDACRHKTDTCEALLRAKEQKIIAQTHIHLNSMSKQDVAAQASMRQTEIHDIERATRQGTSPNPLHNEKLLELKTELAAINTYLEHIRLKECNDLQQIKIVHENLTAESGLSETDQKLSDAIATTISDKSKPRYQAINTITPEAHIILISNNIDPKNFESMAHATALQKNLFEHVGGIVNDTAALSLTYGDNEQLANYVQTTLHSCSDSVHIIKTSSPTQAIVAVTLSSALHRATQVAIATAKGVGRGMVMSVKEVIEQGILPRPIKIVKDLGQMLHFAYEVARIENKTETFKKVLEQFNQLSLEQQTEEVSAFISTLLIPTPNKLHSGILKINKTLSGITKLEKMELEGLKALYRVEHAVAGAAGCMPGQSIAAPFTTSLKDAAHQATNNIARIEGKATKATEQLAPTLINQKSKIQPIVIANTASISAQEANELTAICHNIGQECKEHFALQVATPELQAKVSAYLKLQCEKFKCAEHQLIAFGKKERDKFHFITPDELKPVITNAKDWERLVKVFDGTLTTPSECGKAASIWTDYQHVMSPIITSNCKTGQLRLSGFHHDFLGQIKESGLIEYINTIKHPHGFYACHWKYGNAEKKFSGFFPDNWSPNKVMSKVHEALKNNPIIKLDKRGNWTAFGKISEGIDVLIVLETKNGHPTGKIISAYPVFERGF
ncbi:MAG: EndoU domain-containing protein [Candidatus Babeliales bacterium]|nr:EndoU domain-containing protein [Candidatus Babeliales bacterium]